MSKSHKGTLWGDHCLGHQEEGKKNPFLIVKFPSALEKFSVCFSSSGTHLVLPHVEDCSDAWVSCCRQA